MTGKNDLLLMAVGDVGPKRHNAGEVFDLTRDILQSGDITFGQLESSLSLRGQQQLNMGLGSIGHPRNAVAFATAGFDVMSFASNHALDYGDEALFDTLDVMGENNISVIGAGKNMTEARQPAIFERKGTAIGFLSYCSVVPRGFQAEVHKSGVAPLRASTAYEPIDWQAGMPPKVVTKTYPGDLAAMEDDIRKLHRQVDIVVVSMHWGVHFVPSIIADYQYEAGHAAIDAGADLIIGTHAHILKGIEVYKGKVIFFSLCNFNMDLPLAGPVADEMAASQQRAAITAVKIDKNNRTDVGFHRWEIDPDYPTYAFPIDSQKTMLVKCTISNKKIQRVAFLPLWMNTKGQPEPLSETDPRSDEVFNYMKWLCKDRGLDTRFIRNGDEIVIVTDE